MRLIILSRRNTLYSTSRLVTAAAERGHHMRVIDPLRCYLMVERGRSRVLHNGIEISDCDAVIPRIGSSITEFGLSVVSQFEMLGIPVLNGAAAMAVARDKMRCLQALAQNGLPVPKTLMTRDRDHVHQFLAHVGGAPVVLKLPRGTQGVGVMLAETPESVDSILDTIWGMGQNILIQQFIHEARGRDLRLLVIGDQVVAAMRRVARGREFRANIHRGGAGAPAVPTPQARRLAVEATRTLGLVVAGVDLVESSRGPLILEVNASPGFEEIERATGADIAGRVIDHAAKTNRRLRAVG